jgi:hypothetical protein
VCVCNYSELVEWSVGGGRQHLLGCLFSCGVCQIMANRYDGVILLMSLTVRVAAYKRAIICFGLLGIP